MNQTTSQLGSRIFCGMSWFAFREHLGQRIKDWTKKNLWKTAFRRFEGIWPSLINVMISVWWSRPYPINFFKACLPQILLGPILRIFKNGKIWANAKHTYTESIVWQWLSCEMYGCVWWEREVSWYFLLHLFIRALLSTIVFEI